MCQSEPHSEAAPGHTKDCPAHGEFSSCFQSQISQQMRLLSASLTQEFYFLNSHKRPRQFAQVCTKLATKHLYIFAHFRITCTCPAGVRRE